MNDRELNEVLRAASVPERQPEYWEQFPSRVSADLERRRRKVGAASPGRPTAGAWPWAIALRALTARPALLLLTVAFCLAVALVVGSWKGQRASANDRQLASARKYFREIEALFPNQLQAIIFDQQGARLVLAPKPDLPLEPPLYLKIHGPQGCQRVVTFSGQQISVNGDVCDVLANGQGKVLLVGRQQIWLGSKGATGQRQYRVEARPLESNS